MYASAVHVCLEPTEVTRGGHISWKAVMDVCLAPTGVTRGDISPGTGVMDGFVLSGEG